MTTVKPRETAKSGKTTPTDYQVLVRDSAQANWLELAIVAAHTPDQAIKQVVEDEGYEQEQILVAVPVSRWQPKTVKIETKTTVTLSVPEEAPDDEWAATPVGTEDDGA